MKKIIRMFSFLFFLFSFSLYSNIEIEIAGKSGPNYYNGGTQVLDTKDDLYTSSNNFKKDNPSLDKEYLLDSAFYYATGS